MSDLSVLSWLLKRHEQDGPIPDSCDLIHIRDHAALGMLPPQLRHAGRTWQVARVHGELSLRRQLLSSSALVAVLPANFDPPLDLYQRGYRRRVLTVEAQDVVAAVSGRFSVRIRDEVLSQAILDAPHVLTESGSAWTLGPNTTVTEDEVRSVLLGRALGFDQKLERHRPVDLLARWLRQLPAESTLGGLVKEQLRQTFGLEGEWLAKALDAEGLRNIVAAGALASTEQGQRAAGALLDVPGEREWGRLRTLVERAVRSAAPDLSPESREALNVAEERFHRLNAKAEDAVRFPLLRGALEVALADLMRRCVDGEPSPSDLVDALDRNLHARQLQPAIDLVRASTRLSRFLAAAPGLGGASPEDWIELAREHVAWADLVAREVRRKKLEASPDLQRAADKLSDQYLEVRDRWNREFASVLIRDEARVYNARNRRRPISLSDVSRLLLRPLTEAGTRVLLLVLDGCPLSSFYELLRGWTDEHPIGLLLPDAAASVGDDLRAMGPLLAGVAPLPTLTSHARRALFAGELPKNPVLAEPDTVAANAAGDRRAFDENITLGSTPRRLLLKDEVGVGADDVLAALGDSGLDLVAAVFNGVDDALASHEMTPIPSWTWPKVSGGLANLILKASELGWRVIVTADHGHTEFWHPSRKVSAPSSNRGGQRWKSQPTDRTMELPAGELRPAPVHVLTDMGAWFGTQARGYHGGLSLEEVVVPIAFVGRRDDRPAEWLTLPSWWSEDTLVASKIRESARLKPPTQPPPAPRRPVPSAPAPSVEATAAILSDALLGELSDINMADSLLRRLAEKQQASLAQLGKMMARPPFLVRGTLSKIQKRLHAAGRPLPFEEEERDGDAWYRWKGE